MDETSKPFSKASFAKNTELVSCFVPVTNSLPVITIETFTTQPPLHKLKNVLSK